MHFSAEHSDHPEIGFIVSVAGALLVDHTFELARFPDPDDEILARSYRRAHGGIAANTAVALARLGAPVNLFTATAADSDGTELVEQMTKEGLRVFNDPVPESVTAATYLYVTPGSHRSWVAVLGALRQARWKPEWAAHLAESALLFVDGQPPALSLHACRTAKALGLPIAVDVSNVRYLIDIGWTLDELWTVLAMASFVLPGSSAAAELTGASDPFESARLLFHRLGTEIVVTCGASGAVLAYAGGICKIPARPVDVVDPTGAGDAFHGAYLFARLRGQRPDQAGTFATVAASLTVQGWGAQAPLPSLAEVQTIPADSWPSPVRIT